ncbi:MAG: cyclic pyranopterin monophosphate synthase MoaC [Pirellula sp.]
MDKSITGSDGERQPLTHVNHRGEAKMVDVGGKESTKRIAVATSSIAMSLEAAEAIRANSLKKGDCISLARIAAIQASKQTSHLIPLCHLILIDSVEVEHEWIEPHKLRWVVRVKSTGTTGVEMEALTAASVAALTVYDMCKAIDRSMTISEIMLLEKSGGSRGDFVRSE